MGVKERGFNWRSTYRRTSRTSTAGHHGNRRCTTGNADTDGVNDLDNALGGSYNHPQRGSRPRVSDQQLFNYVVIMLAALPLQLSDYVAAPLSLVNGLSVGLTERSLSPTHDTHVALDLGTPTHPLAANCRSYLQHQGIPISPYTKTEHTTHATTPTCALAHSHAHTRTRQAGMCCCG
jgi:hypothetical protein